MDNNTETISTLFNNYYVLKDISELAKDSTYVLGPLSFLKYAKPYFQYMKSDSERAVAQHIKNKKPLRLSLSYLIEIEIDGRVLLAVSNHHKKFQPIGGVYKINSDLTREITALSTHHFIFDCPDDDWRKIARDADCFKKLLDLYTSGEGVNDNLYREFKEELIDTDILCAEIFPKQDVLDNLSSIRQFTDVEEGQDVNTFYIYDVYKLDLTPKQKDWILNNLTDYVRENKYAWVEKSRLNNYSGKDALVPIQQNMKDKKNIQLARHTKYLNYIE